MSRSFATRTRRLNSPSRWTLDAGAAYRARRLAYPVGAEACLHVRPQQSGPDVDGVPGGRSCDRDVRTSRATSAARGRPRRRARFSSQAIYRTPRGRGRRRSATAVGADRAPDRRRSARASDGRLPDGLRPGAAAAAAASEPQKTRAAANACCASCASSACCSAAAGSTRRWPGFFRVERSDQLMHLDMTSVWVAEHGWST